MANVNPFVELFKNTIGDIEKSTHTSINEPHALVNLYLALVSIQQTMAYSLPKRLLSNVQFALFNMRLIRDTTQRYKIDPKSIEEAIWNLLIGLKTLPFKFLGNTVDKVLILEFHQQMVTEEAQDVFGQLIFKIEEKYPFLLKYKYTRSI